MKIADEEIKMMVDRFLQWKLPKDFHPDGGVSFEPEHSKEYMAQQGKPPLKNEPVGTNLLSATQAEEMVRFMIEPLRLITDEPIRGIDEGIKEITNT